MEDIKEYWKATHPRHKVTLHIIKQRTRTFPWIVCKNFNGERWDCGGLCYGTLEEAIDVFAVLLRQDGYAPELLDEYDNMQLWAEKYERERLAEAVAACTR